MKVEFICDWRSSIEFEIDNFQIPQIGSYIEHMRLPCQYQKDPQSFCGPVSDVRIEYCEKTLKIKKVQIILS